jgi:hypothetical protein
MRAAALISLLPAVLAEFDKCNRPNGEWAGFDQGIGSSSARAVAHAGQHIYVGLSGSGAMSFGTSHANGDYHDHMGTKGVHDSHTDVTVHHETGSIDGTGTSNLNRLNSQLGADSVVYKISETGQPISVYAMDTMDADGVSIDGQGINGVYGGWSYIGGITGFDQETDKVAIVGMARGQLTMPKADGSNLVLKNEKYYSDGGSYDAFVAKIDMATKGVLWATKKGMFNSDMPDRLENKFEKEGGIGKDKATIVPAGTDKDYSTYPYSVVTTAAGHVVASTYNRAGGRQGSLTKFNGANGDVVWSKGLGKHFYSYGRASVDPAGETVYVPGRFKGKDSSSFAPLTKTSCNDGEDTSAVVAAFDENGDASWVSVIGCGGNGAEGTFVEGNFLYVTGDLDEASTLSHADTSSAAKCTMTGDLGGFLVKLSKADGKCVWAKDMAFSKRVAANANTVWTMYSDDDPYEFDAAHTVNPANRDVIMGRFQAVDGVGEWGVAMGGLGRDYAYDMTMTPSGPVAAGYSDSEGVAVGDVDAKNLQHQAEEAKEGVTDSDRNGNNAFFLIQVSINDKHPTCISDCPSGELNNPTTTIASGNCYADAACILDGARSPSRPCFKCESAKSTKDLSGPITNTDEHCFFDGKCVAKGAQKRAYSRYNSASVCEVCQPSVKPDGYSLMAGHFHDRDFANAETGRCSRGCGGDFNQISKYGMVFEMQSNGCQVLPEMNPTVTVSSGSMTTTQKFVEAIKAVNSATKANKGAEKAWMYYHGDSATCAKAIVLYDQDGTAASHNDLCKDTPSHAADTYASAFETILYYGQSMARVKVQQGLVILKAELNNGDQDAKSIADLKQDIAAHMLITNYQQVIHSAHVMKSGTAADKATAKSSGREAWNVIKGSIGDVNEQTRIGNLFAEGVTMDTSFHYCTALEVLKRNMPASSSNIYGSADSDTDRSPSKLDHGIGIVASDHVSKTAEAVKRPMKEVGNTDPNHHRAHLSAADLGVLKSAQNADGEHSCTFPPPTPPPPSPQQPPASVGVLVAGIKEQLANASLTDQERADLEKKLKNLESNQESKDESSGLSEGEIAGVAIGAAIGGVVILGIVGLILRSLLFKEAKPVFTCLEKAPANKKPPA